MRNFPPDRQSAPGTPTVAPFSAETEGAETDPMKVPRTLWRGKWVIFATTSLALLVAALWLVFLAVPTYTAQAVVVLDEQEGELIDVQGAMAGLPSNEETVNTTIEIMRSRGIIHRLIQDLSLLEDAEFNPMLEPAETFSLAWAKEMVIDRLGLGMAEDPTEEKIVSATIDEVLEAIQVANVPDSNVFRIRAESTDPRKAARIANALAEIFILNRLEVRFAATEQAMDWLGEQVADLKLELEEDEQALEAFTTGAEMVSSEALAALGRQLKELRDRYEEAQTTVAETSRRIAVLEDAAEGADAEAFDALWSDPFLSQALTQTGASADAPETVERFIPQLLNQARTRELREKQLAATLAQSIGDRETQIERQSAELVRLQQLEREVQASTVIYEYTLARLKEISVQRGIQEADARVLSGAEVPTEASDPKSGLVLSLAGALGLMAGAGVVLVREGARQVFRTGNDVERETGLPVIGEIPVPQGRGHRRMLKHIMSRRTSPFSEAVRNLRTSILMSRAERLPMVIVLSSAVPGEGKTTQTLALSQSLSMMGKKVLAIDADLRRRSLTAALGVSENAPGLSAAILKESRFEEAVSHHAELGVDFLLADRCKHNPADLFASSNFSPLLEKAKAMYDVIVIDTPPVLLAPDARLLGEFSDALYVVVRWDKTTKWQLVDALRDFRSSQVHVDGAILSQVDPKGMKSYGYGDRRGAYGYGSDYYSGRTYG